MASKLEKTKFELLKLKVSNYAKENYFFMRSNSLDNCIKKNDNPTYVNIANNNTNNINDRGNIIYENQQEIKNEKIDFNEIDKNPFKIATNKKFQTNKSQYNINIYKNKEYHFKNLYLNCNSSSSTNNFNHLNIKDITKNSNKDNIKESKESRGTNSKSTYNNSNLSLNAINTVNNSSNINTINAVNNTNNANNVESARVKPEALQILKRINSKINIQNKNKNSSKDINQNNISKVSKPKLIKKITKINQSERNSNSIINTTRNTDSNTKTVNNNIYDDNFDIPDELGFNFIKINQTENKYNIDHLNNQLISHHNKTNNTNNNQHKQSKLNNRQSSIKYIVYSSFKKLKIVKESSFSLNTNTKSNEFQLTTKQVFQPYVPPIQIQNLMIKTSNASSQKKSLVHCNSERYFHNAVNTPVNDQRFTKSNPKGGFTSRKPQEKQYSNLFFVNSILNYSDPDHECYDDIYERFETPCLKYENLDSPIKKSLTGTITEKVEIANEQYYSPENEKDNGDLCDLSESNEENSIIDYSDWQEIEIHEEDSMLDKDDSPTVTKIPLFKSKKFTNKTNNDEINNFKLSKDFVIKSSFLTLVNTEGVFKKKIFQYLKFNDLINLSMTNKYLKKETQPSIYKIIINIITLHNSQLLRLNIWKSILPYSKIPRNELSEIYHRLLNTKSKYEDEIKKDLLRTMPEDKSFKEGRVNFKKLGNILKVYSLYNENIGYAQGLNFIVANSLYVINTEEVIYLKNKQ